MASSLSFLKSVTMLSTQAPVKFQNGGFAKITNLGMTQLTSFITISDVLYVPSLF